MCFRNLLGNNNQFELFYFLPFYEITRLTVSSLKYLDDNTNLQDTSLSFS